MKENHLLLNLNKLLFKTHLVILLILVFNLLYKLAIIL